MNIRVATEYDLKDILEIYNHSIINTTAVYSYEPWSFKDIKNWFLTKKESGYAILVAVKEEKVSGFASFGLFRNWPAYKNSVEHSVHIHPDFRRQGLASMLINKIIIEAKLRKMHTLIGGVDANNKGSIQLHLNLGFKEVGHFKQVGYKFDNWLDLKFFQLILDSTEV